MVLHIITLLTNGNIMYILLMHCVLLNAWKTLRLYSTKAIPITLDEPNGVLFSNSLDAFYHAVGCYTALKGGEKKHLDEDFIAIRT